MKVFSRNKVSKSSKTKEPEVAAPQNLASNSSSKKRLIRIGIYLILILVVLAGILLLIEYRASKKDKTTQIYKVCNSGAKDSIDSQAAGLLSEANTTKLNAMADQIMNKAHYDTDPNCLYILTVHDMNNGDTSSAIKHYATMYALVGSSKLDPQLTAKSGDIVSIKKRLDAIVEQSKKSQSSFVGTGAKSGVGQ